MSRRYAVIGGIGGIGAIGALILIAALLATRGEPEAPRPARATASPVRTPNDGDRAAAVALLAEPAQHGSARIVGRVLMPGGKPAPRGVVVRLAVEARLRGHVELAEACQCEGCELEHLIEACDGYATEIAKHFADHAPRAVDHRETTTGEGGRFLFERLEPATYAVWATAEPDAAPAISSGIEVGSTSSTEVELQLGTPATLEGVVRARETAQAIAGARVIAVDHRMGHLVETQSSTDGRFRLEGLDGGEQYYLLAAAEGWVEEGLFASGDETAVELLLSRWAAIEGIVTLDGRPRAGVKITTGDDDDLSRITDAQGEFRFEKVLPGELDIYAEAEAGLGAAILVSVEAGEKKKVEIEIYRTCALQVTVVDVQGQPLPDIDVDVMPLVEPEEDDLRISDFYDFSSEDGFVEFDLIPPGKYRVVAGNEELGEESSEIQLCKSSEPESLRFVIGKHPGLAGIVLDEKNRPIEDATIELRSHEPGQPVVRFESDMRVGYSDEKGRFRIANLAAGNWQLSAAKRGFKRTVLELTRRPSDPYLEQTIVLSRGASIRGRVIGAEDRPLPGWEIDAYPAVWDEYLAHPQARSKKSGKFVLRGLEDGARYRLNARGPGEGGFTEWVEAVAGETDVVLRAISKQELTERRLAAEKHRREDELLEQDSGESGSLIGRVLDAETESPIAGVRLELTHDGEMPRPPEARARTISGSLGEFRFENLKPGRVRVIARAEGYTPAYEAAVVLSSEMLAEPEAIAIRMAHGFVVSGHVSIDRRTSELIRVGINPAVWRGGYYESTKVDERGEFVLRSPTKGPHRLRVTRLRWDGREHHEQIVIRELEIPEGGVSGVEVAMPAGSATVVIALPRRGAARSEPFEDEIEVMLVSGGGAADHRRPYADLGLGAHYVARGAYAGKEARIERVMPGEYAMYARSLFGHHEEVSISRSIVVPASGEVRVDAVTREE